MTDERDPLGIVEKFGTEVKRALEEGVDAASKTVIDETLSRFMWWCVGTIFGSAVVSAGMVYLMNSFGQPDSWSIDHNGAVENCAFSSGSTNAHPMFVCKPAPEPSK